MVESTAERDALTKQADDLLDHVKEIKQKRREAPSKNRPPDAKRSAQRPRTPTGIVGASFLCRTSFRSAGREAREFSGSS